jgi:hypothetical protein
VYAAALTGLVQSLRFLRIKPIVLLALETVLFYRHVNSQNDSDLLQKDLSALEKWEEEWQMSFHPQKCTVDAYSSVGLAIVV